MQVRAMPDKNFLLVATISTDNPEAIRPVMKRLIGQDGSVKEVGPDEAKHGGRGEFLIKAKMDGTNSKDLNRSLLSELRRAEKRTRLRAEWTSDGMTERYFDYGLKERAGK
jgi:hypothetical protein